MSAWPPIDEPELLARLALDDDGFAEMMRGFAANVPARPCDAETVALALDYPWQRPDDSYRLYDGEVEPLAGLSVGARGEMVDRFADPAAGRVPVVAIGSNGAPEALRRKFAHFDDAVDREILVLVGALHGFDVGVSPQPALYGALPATLFPSPGTAVRVALLWVTSAQFTQLAWSELSYRLGRLRARFEPDMDGACFDDVLVFVSRFGAFCPGGDSPAALAAVAAEGRSAAALTQEQLLDAAAAQSLGQGATAEDLVRAVFAEFAATGLRLATTTHRAARPFASELWTPFRPTPPA